MSSQKQATKNKKQKKGKIAAVIVSAVLILLLVVVLVFANSVFGLFHKGNGPAYSLQKVEKVEGSVLEGKTIYCLGSSVTAGFASLNVSFADYLAKADGCTVVKEAVSGTTLIDNGEKSYVQRLDNFPTAAPDVFICQLSTNDAKVDPLALGDWSLLNFNKDSFDKTTTYGAIEYIIASVHERWPSAKIVFYTSNHYDSITYKDMVTQLKLIALKWNILANVTVLDLFNNTVFNQLTEAERALYLNDEVHPTRAGYMKWWLPEFQKKLYSLYN